MLIVGQVVKCFPPSMEPEGSLLYSEQSATVPYLCSSNLVFIVLLARLWP
jgi:hypothetical protein